MSACAVALRLPERPDALRDPRTSEREAARDVLLRDAALERPGDRRDAEAELRVDALRDAEALRDRLLDRPRVLLPERRRVEADARDDFRCDVQTGHRQSSWCVLELFLAMHSPCLLSQYDADFARQVFSAERKSRIAGQQFSSQGRGSARPAPRR